MQHAEWRKQCVQISREFLRNPRSPSSSSDDHRRCWAAVRVVFTGHISWYLTGITTSWDKITVSLTKTDRCLISHFHPNLPKPRRFTSWPVSVTVLHIYPHKSSIVNIHVCQIRWVKDCTASCYLFAQRNVIYKRYSSLKSRYYVLVFCYSHGFPYKFSCAISVN